MHILFLTWKDIRHPHAGGAERVMLEYAKGLISHGHEVVWFASAFPGSQEQEFIDGIKIIRKYHNHTIWMFAWWWYRKYKSLYSVDLIIDEAGGWPLLSPIYEKKVPIYFFIHHIPEKEFDIVSPPLSYLIRFLYNRMIICYRDIPTITVSNSTKNELVSKFLFPPTNIHVIENTTEIAPIEKIDFLHKGNDIIFLGRLTTIKRPDNAIKAFSLALSDLPDTATLNIIGNAQDKKYVESLHLLVKSLHIEKKVVFHGFLQAEKYHTLLKNARCMIVPSQKEGYGLVVIEANAYGLPVIAYDVAGLRDSVKPQVNGVLVQDGNIADMAGAIREMFANEESYRILAEKSLKYAKNVPKWSDQVQKFENIIQSP